MRANVRLMFVLASFFVVAAVAYVVWNIAYEAQGLNTDPNSGEGASTVEWVGTTALFLSAAFAALIGFFLQRVHRAQSGELPQDIESANVDDGDPELGFFSPHSWWPITLAGGGALVFLGLAVGIWIALFGAILLVIALVGWTYEYYRGWHAR
ncbi:cytochrome c oxidase subunit 4 [Clavibacter zhangzhiyongii]|uniref:aa3-type cytochrome oxidase subunit IV n=1 Tax=Clavibacter zhangzhiyongii TaxID=2768071 RepID=UPI0039E1FA1A